MCAHKGAETTSYENSMCSLFKNVSFSCVRHRTKALRNFSVTKTKIENPFTAVQNKISTKQEKPHMDRLIINKFIKIFQYFFSHIHLVPHFPTIPLDFRNSLRPKGFIWVHLLALFSSYY